MEPVANTLLIDGHVHFQRCFGLGQFLESADRNFAAARKQLALPESAPGCLFLTETAHENSFARLREGLEKDPSLGWRVEPAEEAASYWLTREAAASSRILVVAGRQVASSEGLEVLGIGLQDQVPENRPAAETLREVADAGGAPILPWGFGKWTGRRARVVASLLKDQDGLPRFFIGDNGGRPRSLPRPRLFALAESLGRFVLPGSDPLPLPAQAVRPGGYGFALQTPLPLGAPFRAVQASLASLQRSPRPFGSPRPLIQAIASQFALRLARRG